jgi:hypothetical protein
VTTISPDHRAADSPPGPAAGCAPALPPAGARVPAPPLSPSQGGAGTSDHVAARPPAARVPAGRVGRNGSLLPSVPDRAAAGNQDLFAAPSVAWPRRRRRTTTAQGVLFGRHAVHLFRFDPSAVRVNPRGGTLGEKLTIGAWRCAICTIDGEFAEVWGADCCPGWAEPAPPSAFLGIAAKAGDLL